MLTPEREAEMRSWSRRTQDCEEAEAVPELLAEIDRLRVWSSDSHVTDLEKERGSARTILRGEKMKQPKPKGASIEIDDAFTPTEIRFKECDYTIEFFIDGEQVRVQVFDGDDFKMGMRLPLYVQTALAQMFTQTLNGQRFFNANT